MSYFLRRLPLARLLAACALAVALGACVTALAFALGSGSTPPPKPLADAIHDALAGSDSETVEGVSASIQLTDHLLEGANLASGGEAGGLSSSPLVTGGSGRLWIAKDGRVRLELQSEQGDTQILCDGHAVSLYDAATNTLYRYTLPSRDEGSSSDAGGSSGQGSSSGEGGASGGQGSSQPEGSGAHHEVPSVAKIEEAISRLSQHVNVSGAMPTDIAGRPAYTVRVSPKEGGSLLGGAELSWDADNGVPLRAAIYSTNSSSPAIELAASEISYGPVESSVFEFSPPPGAKVEEGSLGPQSGESSRANKPAGERPKLTTHGHGPATIAVLEGKVAHEQGNSAEQLEELPKVKISGTSASELSTELGTLLTFERAGVRYVVAGAVPATAVEEVARGL
jgi:outer membrane lipoprotein-sorting protein